MTVQTKESALLHKAGELLEDLLKLRDREAIRQGHPMGDSSPKAIHIREFVSAYRKYLKEHNIQRSAAWDKQASL